MKFMRGLFGLAPALALLAGCQQAAPPAPAPTAAAPAAPAQSPVQRGKYLVTVGGCNDCHTPKKFGPNGPEYDMDKELSGNPASEKVAGVPKGLIAPGKWGTIANNHLGAWA